MSKAAKRERQKENRERAREERERLERRQRQTKTFRSLLIVLVPIMVILVVVSLTSGSDSKASSETKRNFSKPPAMTIDPNKSYTAVMKTGEGTITLALDAKTAPIATNNFVFLARHNFYDGLTFHRAAKDFVIQGGDPKGDGSGGPGYSVTGEVPTDHYPVGALAAAKTGNDPAGTMGSQFFIVTGSQGATLPNDYARFGSVIAGLDVAQKIGGFAPASGDGVPTKKVKIDKVTIKESGAAATSTTTAAATTSTTG